MDFIPNLDPLYEKIRAPNQTNQQFQELLAAANDRGVVYTSPKGKGKEAESGHLSGANHGGIITTVGKHKEAVPRNPLSEAPPASSAYHIP